MGLGGGTGGKLRVYVDYRGKLVDVMRLPRDSEFYLVNVSNEEMLGESVKGREAYSRLVEQSKPWVSDNDRWDYFNDEFAVIEKKDLEFYEGRFRKIS